MWVGIRFSAQWLEMGVVPRFSSKELGWVRFLRFGRLGVAWVLADRVSWGWPELMRTIGTITVDMSGALLLYPRHPSLGGSSKNNAHAHIST